MSISRTGWTSRDKYPCKDCQKRQPGCQDHCEEYKSAKAVNEARKEKERKARNLQHELNGFAMRGRQA